MPTKKPVKKTTPAAKPKKPAVKKPAVKKPAPKKAVKKDALKGAKRCIAAIVLDRSGSMGSMRQEAVDAFNEQIREIKKHSKELPTKVCLVTFSSNVDTPLFWNVDVDKIEDLTYDRYVPDGMTAMRDAVGYTVKRIQEIKDAAKKDTAILDMTISDGQENNSKEFSDKELAELVQESQKTKRWTFTYLGANQDLSQVCASTGISAGSARAFCASPIGMKYASVAQQQGVSEYYGTLCSSRNMSVDNFYQDVPDDKINNAGTGNVKPGAIKLVHVDWNADKYASKDTSKLVFVSDGTGYSIQDINGKVDLVADKDYNNKGNNSKVSKKKSTTK